jgi:hypothetical protein
LSKTYHYVRQFAQEAATGCTEVCCKFFRCLNQHSTVLVLQGA